MKKQHRLKGFIFIIILLIIIVTLLIFTNKLGYFLKDPAKLREFVNSFGIFAPIIYIILQAIQAIFPIIPGQLMIILSGALFGIIKGSIYCLIGITIGISVVFLIAKKYGRKVVKSWIDKKELKKVDNFFKEHGSYAVFLGRIIPLFPNDVISFSAGLTKIRFRSFIIASLIAFIPGIILLNILGAQLIKGLLNIKTIIILLLVIVLFIILYRFKHQLRIYIHKGLLVLEKKIKRKHIYLFFAIVIIGLWIHNNTGLETYPADTYLSSITVLNTTIVYDRFIMDRTQPFFYERGNTAILLLHGFGGSPYELRELGEYLADRNITVYAPLLAGHGSTIDYLSKVSWTDVYDDAKFSLDLLKENYDDVYTAGLCNGGMLSLYLAEKEDVKGVISLSTPLLLSHKLIDKLPLEKMFKVMKYFTKYLRKIIYGSIRNQEAIKGMPVFEGAPITELINVEILKNNVKKDLSKIDEPILIIQSTFDNRAAPESAEYIYNHISSEDKKLVWLNNSGHIITLDYDKEIVSDEVYKFITSTNKK